MTIIDDISRWCEGHIVSREDHNKTIYVHWHGGKKERIKGEPAQTLWHLPNGAHFTAQGKWAWVDRQFGYVHSLEEIKQYEPISDEELNEWWEAHKPRRIDT